jgi:hypothetical protein
MTQFLNDALILELDVGSFWFTHTYLHGNFKFYLVCSLTSLASARSCKHLKMADSTKVLGPSSASA